MYNKSEQTQLPVSTEVLASIGADHLVYVRPLMVDGQAVFGIYSAAGAQIGTAPSRDVAFALAIQNGVEPVSVH
jgi:hypothetical protein